MATFLAGSLEAQSDIEIESLNNTEHFQVGQMSVGSTLYGTFLPKNCSEKVATFLAGSLEAQSGIEIERARRASGVRWARWLSDRNSWHFLLVSSFSLRRSFVRSQEMPTRAFAPIASMCPFRTHCVIEVFPRGRGDIIAHHIRSKHRSTVAATAYNGMHEDTN